jgi:hypothetical protein
MAQMSLKVAVFNSNDIYPISADTMPFAQHVIFFTSGVDQEEHSITFPDAPYEHQRNFILKETNEHIAVWEKPKKIALAVWNQNRVLVARI